MDNLWIKNVKDSQMKKVVVMANNIASRKATVMIYGESGVGKELMAKYIHQSSQRSDKAFVAVNCAAMPENLLESELFGYEKGAFTGAHQTKQGKLEVADKGTFLLDEISEMPLALQGKLLRVIQESEIERLGSTSTRKIDVRIICTSNKSLLEMVKKGEFRQDLFYRLNVIPITIPPLRARKKDITSLVEFFLDKVSRENGIEKKSLAPQALEKIHKWSWPGNVRELQNVIERSCLLATDPILHSENLQIECYDIVSSGETDLVQTGMTIQEAEKRLILKTLEYTEQNRTQAAKILGISIRTLRNKINEYKNDGIAKIIEI